MKWFIASLVMRIFSFSFMGTALLSFYHEEWMAGIVSIIGAGIAWNCADIYGDTGGK